MIFEWVNLKEVPQEIVAKFDCGEESFNYFLKEKATDWATNGYAVTYVAVDGDETVEKDYSRIYGYAAINATGLLGKNNGKNKYLSCAEIRMFAVSKFLRGDEAVDSDGIRYSFKIFQSLMQELYYISTSVIGFSAVTLNANNTGLDLYRKFGFICTDEYFMPEEEEKIDIDDCTPLIFSLMGSDALYSLFI